MKRLRGALNASLKVFLEPAAWHVMPGRRRPCMTCQAAGSRKIFNEAFKRSLNYEWWKIITKLDHKMARPLIEPIFRDQFSNFSYPLTHTYSL